MGNDNKYLQLKRNTWYLHKRVPDYARALTGGSMIWVKSLQTSCIKQARIRRDMLLADLHTKIEALSGDTERANYLWRLANIQSKEQAEMLLDVEANKKRIAAGVEPDLPLRLIEATTEADIKAARNYIYDMQYPEYGYSLKDGAKAYRAFKAGSYKSTKDLSRIDLATKSFLFAISVKDIPLAQITRKQVKCWLSQLDMSGKTKKNYLSALRGIWNHALDLEEIAEGSNPFDRHNISTKATQSYQLFEDQELSVIFAELMSQPRLHRRLIPMMGLVTGCRIEELCQLRSEDVKEEDGVPYISIREGKTKAATRLIPLHPWVASEVLQQAEKTKGDYLFPALTTREDGIRSDSLSKWFGRLKKRHGVTRRDKSFHSLRVHMATALERGDVPEETATFILGHERTMSMSYGLYSKGKTIRQLYEAVLSAKFPECVVPDATLLEI